MRGLAPEILRSGNKIYQLKLKRKPSVCPRMVFKDSFNFLLQRLEMLPKTMELSVQSKMFFCHGWNKEENMNLQLQRLPDRKYYYPESLGSKQKRDQFEKFYNENENKPFLLSDALKEYCGMIFLLSLLQYFYVFFLRK